MRRLFQKPATTVFATAFVCSLAATTLACQRPPDPRSEPADHWACKPLAAVTGPEDFVIDETNQRLLVSSQDRRAPQQPGAIVAVWPASGSRRVLPLRDRGTCSFHPHGMTLVPTSPPRLYVINHHDAIDTTTDRACFPGVEDGRGQSLTSVEVFTVHPHELRFVERLANPDMMPNANDLDADRAGNLYITVPPAGVVGMMAESVRSKPTSKVVSFQCHTPQEDGTCLGQWVDVAKVGRFVNGIALVQPGENARLMVSSTIDGVITQLRRQHGAWGITHARSVPGGHDNLMWLNAEKTTLLVASHPNLRRLLQHATSPRASSPSTVWTMPLDPARPATEVFYDDGSTISGISTAACFEGRLILGQIFGQSLLTCQLPHLCGASPQPQVTPEARP